MTYKDNIDVRHKTLEYDGSSIGLDHSLCERNQSDIDYDGERVIEISYEDNVHEIEMIKIFNYFDDVGIRDVQVNGGRNEGKSIVALVGDIELQ